MAVKIHLYDGTSQTKGQEERQRDRAVIMAYVSDTATGDAGLDAAIDAAAAEAGDTHPQDSTLPLIEATGRRLNPTSAWVSLVYGRTSATPATVAASSLAIERVEYETRAGWNTLTVVDDNGAPIGGQVLRTFTRRPFPLTRLIIPTILSSRPNISGQIGRINQDSLQLLNAAGTADTSRTFGFCTMRCDGAQIMPFEHKDGLKYRILYNFVHRSLGWYRWLMVRGFFLEGDPIPEPKKVPMYSTAVFGGTSVFPTHDAGGVFHQVAAGTNCNYDIAAPED